MRKKIVPQFTVFVFCFILFSTAPAQDRPPLEPVKREADLIELVKLDNTIKLDIRYARNDNFVGRQVYPEARAFLQRPAAEAVLRVHKKLKTQGLGLVIFDGYRPWSITKLFWEVTPEDKRKFVADPARGSKHNRGCAVDLSIYDLKTGRLLPMPSEYDEFTERASPGYGGGTPEETRNRELLRRLMEAEGFTVNPNEWWHFDYKDWQEYGIYDIPFSVAENMSQKKAAPQIEELRSLRKFFDATGVTGGIYIYDLRKNKLTASDRRRMNTGFVPASTSKIVHSLIFLDSGVVKNDEEVFTWDGVRRRVPAWNRNHNLRSAFKESAVWVYVEASKRLGREAMQRYYDAAGYGNRETSGFGEDYWNTGKLRVTPREQIELLVRLYENRLPFSPQAMWAVKDMMIEEKTGTYTLRAKTGWSDSFTPQVGWWVGYVEREADVYFFATQIDITKNEDAALRKELTKRVLREMKMID